MPRHDSLLLFSPLRWIAERVNTTRALGACLKRLLRHGLPQPALWHGQVQRRLQDTLRERNEPSISVEGWIATGNCHHVTTAGQRRKPEPDERRTDAGPLVLGRDRHWSEHTDRGFVGEVQSREEDGSDKASFSTAPKQRISRSSMPALDFATSSPISAPSSVPSDRLNVELKSRAGSSFLSLSILLNSTRSLRFH